jgi:hypothetical protein
MLLNVTTQFLGWSCGVLEAEGKRVLVLVWDNAAWHVSREVRTWIKEHNRAVKQSGKGVRILVCRLPTKSPWLNAIEPKWVHGKKQVVEPHGKAERHRIEAASLSLLRVRPAGPACKEGHVKLH